MTDTPVPVSPPLLSEPKLTLTQARNTLDGRPSVAALWRWCRKGLRGVKLEYLREGRRIVTSRAALDRFFQRLTELDQSAAASAAVQAGPKPRAASDRARCVARAERELALAGI